MYFHFTAYVKAESHYSSNENDHAGILFVELLHTEYAHAHSTNRMRSLCVVIVIIFIIAEV